MAVNPKAVRASELDASVPGNDVVSGQGGIRRKAVRFGSDNVVCGQPGSKGKTNTLNLSALMDQGGNK